MAPATARHLRLEHLLSTWLITRHPGAVAWMRARGIAYDRHLQHLDVSAVKPGDVVIGTLPVPLAARVCALGAAYRHLSLDLPEHLRGRELDVDELNACNARIEEFRVVALT